VEKAGKHQEGKVARYHDKVMLMLHKLTKHKSAFLTAVVVVKWSCWWGGWSRNAADANKWGGVWCDGGSAAVSDDDEIMMMMMCGTTTWSYQSWQGVMHADLVMINDGWECQQVQDVGSEDTADDCCLCKKVGGWGDDYQE
jgi:hypothetical protein